MLNRKKIVLEQALSLFVEKGVAKTSIQDIIERSNISKGTFYNYFSSKHECIEAILDKVRYDATLMKVELMIGKDEKDLEVLINQASVLSNINRKRGLDLLFEELLYSGDLALKNLVLKHRMLELNWFSERIVEIYGEEAKNISFEAASIYYAIVHNLTFSAKLIGQNRPPENTIASTLRLYINMIVNALMHDNTSLLDSDKVNRFKAIYRNPFPIELPTIIEKLEEFLLGNFPLAKQQVIEALLQEVQLTPLRPIVLNALLNSFLMEFSSTDYQEDAKELSSMIWYYERYINTDN